MIFGEVGCLGRGPQWLNGEKKRLFLCVSPKFFPKKGGKKGKNPKKPPGEKSWGPPCIQWAKNPKPFCFPILNPGGALGGNFFFPFLIVGGLGKKSKPIKKFKTPPQKKKKDRDFVFFPPFLWGFLKKKKKKKIFFILIKKTKGGGKKRRCGGLFFFFFFFHLLKKGPPKNYSFFSPKKKNPPLFVFFFRGHVCC